MAIIPDGDVAQAQEVFHQASQHLTVILTLAELMNRSELLDNSFFEDVKFILEQSHCLKDNFHHLQALLIPGQTSTLYRH